MFDLNATLRWIKGIVQDPHGTAQAYRETAAPWKQTFMQITLPAVVASFVGALILSLLFRTSMAFGAPASAPLLAILTLAWMFAALFIFTFIVDFFAGKFHGTQNYDAAFAMVSLAYIPGLIGSMLAPLPWIGWLISLAAGIYSLVLLYQFIPVFLSVPQDDRVKHFVVTLIVAFVVNLILSIILGLGGMSSMDRGGYAGTDSSEQTSGTWGALSGMERQAALTEAATQDSYEPPADGKLSEEQVERYANVLRKTASLQERLGKRFEEGEEPESLSDVLGGVGDAMRMQTSEMEVVKTGDGNWAEHQWVRNQIETARVQQDTNETIKHNYALFLEYQDEIEAYE